MPGEPQQSLLNVSLNPGPAPAGGDGTNPAPPEPEEVKLASQPWTDEYAKTVVTNDFRRAQTHRSQNFDTRWNNNETLLHANVPQRYWDGSDVPRSSIGVKLVWQQLYSALPKMRESLLSSTDGIFFDVFACPGTRPEQTIATRELQASQLNDTAFSSHLDLANYSGVEHGCGILKLCQLHTTRDKLYWEERLEPTFANLGGMNVAIGVQHTFGQKKQKIVVNQPKVGYVSLKDFYIDPSHKFPWVNAPEDFDGGSSPQFVIERGMLTLGNLLEMKRNDKSFKGMPSKEELISYVRNKQGPAKADADSNKQQAAQEAGVTQSYPAIGSVDPEKYPFEVLEYWSEDRLVHLLERKWVIRSIPNPYGFIPYFAVIPWPVLDQFYGKGLAEILEGEQRIQQGIINGRLDELSLNLHGQIIYQEGAVIGKHQLRPRPGGAIGVTGDVDKAVKRLDRQEMTGQAFVEVQQSQSRAEQYTGIGFGIQGAPSVPTSATRTKFGSGIIAGSNFSRIQYLAEIISDNVIVPLLKKQHKLNSLYLDPQQAIAILGPSLAKELIINPLDVANGDFKFEVRVAARLAAKQAMQQNLPFILQTYFNPALMQTAYEQGWKINFPAVSRDIFDVMGWRSKNDWFIRVTPEEQQAKQEQSQMADKFKLMKQQMQIEGKSENQKLQLLGDFMKMLAEKSFDQAPGAAPQALGAALEAVNQ